MNNRIYILVIKHPNGLVLQTLVILKECNEFIRLNLINQGFNKELEEIFRIQKGYAIPDQDLRESLKADNKHFVCPPYKIFLEKYEKMNFTKNKDKYIKYSVEDVEKIINQFFDTSA